MKIFICSSKHFYYMIPPIKAKLEEMGNIVTLPNCYENPGLEGRLLAQDPQIHAKFKAEMLREQCNKVASNDALLVLNHSKNGVENYIGGATFLEMFKAFELSRRIYLLNPIPEGILRDEIAGFSPIVIDGDLTKIEGRSTPMSLVFVSREAKEQTESLLVSQGRLSPAYTLSSMSKGREKEDKISSWRTCFELDRDRIIHSNSYRRLRDKAQVHILPREDNLTTRLIHTEEVYQVADSICNFLGLNRTLAEAIARGHDLGHTPFGNVGESALSEIMKEYLNNKDYSFDHAEYGLRVVDCLERDGRGINLTEEVRDGILKHSTGCRHLGDAKNVPFTPEGKAVLYADKIAYVCGDLEDSIRVGVIDKAKLPADAIARLGRGKADWIGKLISAVVESSLEAQEVTFKGDCFSAFEEIRIFMYDNVYGACGTKDQQKKSKRALRLVFDHIMDTRYGALSQADAAYKTLDDVACMTDVSLIRYLKDNFVPREVY